MVLLTFWSVWVWLCLAGLLESWPFWPLAWASFGWAERSNNKNELLLLNSRHNLHWWMMMKHMIIIKSQKAKQTNPFFTTTIYRKCHKTKKIPKFLPEGTSTLTWNFPRKMKRKFEKIERLNLRYTTDFLISHMRGESRTARHLPCLWQVLLKRRGGTTLLRNQFFFQYLRNDDAVGSISWVEQRSRKSSFNEVLSKTPSCLIIQG